MIRVSDYSLNYSQAIAAGKLTVLDFLGRCRQLDLDAAALHVRNLPQLGTEYLKEVRRAYLDQGLSVSMLTVTNNFGRPAESERREFETALEAIRVGMFLGAPLLRLFAGSPVDEADRPAAFRRAADGIRRVCAEAAQWGLPVGLQNHNHQHLCRTGDDVLRMLKLVDHPNLTYVLDTGQFAGSPGASGATPAELQGANYLASIQQTASLARHVRVKFYNPRPDGSEPNLDYDRIFDVLRGVHYQGILDIVYEPARHGGADVNQALPRIAGFLRRKIQAG